MRILEAKQALEDVIAAQEFSRAAELKDVITGLENQRDQIVKEIAESNQPVDKDAPLEKVHTQRGWGHCWVFCPFGKNFPVKYG